tara:strand:+ start:333 stop:1082 length:750 start_codon:yes stop_codon:yes gene_type:complete
MTNLVSIIIPYYKKKFFFKKTIKSILRQTYNNYEVILIYDDPNKKDLNFVKKILKNIKKKTIITNKFNMGAGSSRNIGIKRAKGKFIAFIDADDLWHKDKLKKQISFMKHKRCDFSYTGYSIMNEGGALIKNIKATKLIDYISLIRSCDIGTSTVVLKKVLLKRDKFPKTITKEDYILWLKLCKKGIKMRGLNLTLASWRKSSNSLSSSVFQKIRDAYIVYNKHLKFNLIKSIYSIMILSINAVRKRNL